MLGGQLLDGRDLRVLWIADQVEQTAANKARPQSGVTLDAVQTAVALANILLFNLVSFGTGDDGPAPVVSSTRYTSKRPPDPYLPGRVCLSAGARHSPETRDGTAT